MPLLEEKQEYLEGEKKNAEEWKTSKIELEILHKD